jgi:hypothetical protein
MSFRRVQAARDFRGSAEHLPAIMGDRIMSVVQVGSWTPWLVESQLVEAADTLCRLPAARVGGYASAWPPLLGAAIPTGKSTHIGSPSAAAIDRMDTTLLWMGWLGPRDRQIVWRRACGWRWKMIASEQSIDRTTAWRHWAGALLDIAMRLNARHPFSAGPAVGARQQPLPGRNR